MTMNSLALKLLIVITLSLGFEEAGLALPPPEDTPDEILRTEIIVTARSPIDGQPLTTAEYAELEAELATSKFSPQVDRDLQHLIFLLRIRKMINTFIPFSPL